MLCRSVGKLIIDVGLLVAEQCDRYLQQQNPAWPPGTLQRSIADSACAKVGLLCCQDPAAAVLLCRRSLCTALALVCCRAAMLCWIFGSSPEVQRPAWLASTFR